MQYSTNAISKVICCSEKRIEGLESTNPENLKSLLHKKKDLYDTLWNEGIVIGGKKRFYTFMWEIAEKRVIGVGA